MPVNKWFGSRQSPITSGLKVKTKVKVFFKVGQTSRSRSQGQKLLYHVKGLVTRNTHLQYEESLTSSGLKVMAKIKVFQKYVKLQGQGKKLWSHVKCLVTRNTQVQYESPIWFGGCR